MLRILIILMILNICCDTVDFSNENYNLPDIIGKWQLNDTAKYYKTQKGIDMWQYSKFPSWEINIMNDSIKWRLSSLDYCVFLNYKTGNMDTSWNDQTVDTVVSWGTYDQTIDSLHCNVNFLNINTDEDYNVTISGPTYIESSYPYLLINDSTMYWFLISYEESDKSTWGKVPLIFYKISD